MKEGKQRKEERERERKTNRTKRKGERQRQKIVGKKGEQKVLTLSTSSQGVENCLNSEMGRGRGLCKEGSEREKRDLGSE